MPPMKILKDLRILLQDEIEYVDWCNSFESVEYISVTDTSPCPPPDTEDFDLDFFLGVED